MRTLADGGSLFYSDQEDLGTPPKAATVQAANTKKAAPQKRVTQAAVMEKVDALASQMQLLVARQDQLEEQSKESFARDVSAPLAASACALPPVSASLVAGEGVTRGLTAVQKAVSLTGPPPRHREVRPPADAPIVPLEGTSKVRGGVVGPGGSSLEVALM